MKPAPFTYVRPNDLQEAIAHLRASNGMAKVLAGGQSLVPLLNLRLAQPELIVDISRIAELSIIEEDENSLLIGACVSHAAFEDGIVPDVAGGLLQRVGAAIGYRAIRNLGTIGGSMAHADPAAEWPVLLVALDAVIGYRNPDGRQEVRASEFILGPFTTVLQDNEILADIRIARLSLSAKSGFYKTCRKSGEFADSLAVIVIDPERPLPRVVLGATNDRPLLLATTGNVVASLDAWSPAAEHAVREAVTADLETAFPSLDPYGGQIHRVTVVRAVREALSS